ncbi:unnamed protein product, partial [Ectocarpus sp. 12 AP-2014]
GPCSLWADADTHPCAESGISKFQRCVTDGEKYFHHIKGTRSNLRVHLRRGRLLYSGEETPGIVPSAMSALEAFVSWPVHHHQWLPDPPLPSPAVSAFATNVGGDNGAAVGLSRRTSCCRESGGRGTDQVLLGLWFSDENRCASFGRKRRRQGPYGRLWLPLASSATPTPTPPPASIESDGTAAKGDGGVGLGANIAAVPVFGAYSTLKIWYTSYTQRAQRNLLRKSAVLCLKRWSQCRCRSRWKRS